MRGGRGKCHREAFPALRVELRGDEAISVVGEEGGLLQQGMQWADYEIAYARYASQSLCSQ